MIVRKKRGSISKINSRLNSRKANNKVKQSKKHELLYNIDSKLDDIDKKYGPIVYEELQSRLVKTIDMFHEDIDNLFKNNFSSYNNDHQIKSNSNEKLVKPKYISDYEKSKED